MSRLRGFARFWYDFIVGDDWRLAGAALVALALSGLAAPTSLPAWLIAPVVIVAVLGVSVLRYQPR